MSGITGKADVAPAGLAGVLGHAVSPEPAGELSHQFVAAAGLEATGAPAADGFSVAAPSALREEVAPVAAGQGSSGLTCTFEQLRERQKRMASAETGRMSASSASHGIDDFGAFVDGLLSEDVPTQTALARSADPAGRVRRALAHDHLEEASLAVMIEVADVLGSPAVDAAVKEGLLDLIVWDMEGRQPSFPIHYHSLVKRAKAADELGVWEQWLRAHASFDGTPTEFVALVRAERGDGALDDSLLVLLHHREQALCRGVLDLPPGRAHAEIVTQAWVHLVAQLAAEGLLSGVRRALVQDAIQAIGKASDASTFGATEDAEWLTAALASAQEREKMAKAASLPEYLQGYMQRTTPQEDQHATHFGATVSGLFSIPIELVPKGHAAPACAAVEGVVPELPDTGGVPVEVDVDNHFEVEAMDAGAIITGSVVERAAISGKEQKVSSAGRAASPVPPPAPPPAARADALNPIAFSVSLRPKKPGEPKP